MASKRWVAGCVVCAGLGTAFGPAFAGAAANQFKDVVIRNGDDQPVPTKAIGTTQVAGSVGVTGTPSVNVANTPSVSLAGTPSVNVAGTPSVNVAGTPSVKVANDQPIAVTSVDQSPVATPIARQLTFTFNGSAFDDAEYAVPAGKRLVMEFFTFHDFNREVGVKSIIIQATTGGQQVSHRIATSTQADGGDVSTEQVAISADPGSTVRVHVTLDGVLGGEFSTHAMYGSFTGRLIDA